MTSPSGIEGTDFSSSSEKERSNDRKRPDRIDALLPPDAKLASSSSRLLLQAVVGACPAFVAMLRGCFAGSVCFSFIHILARAACVDGAAAAST